MGARLVAPHMVAQRSGRIISIASIQAFAVTPGVGSYNAAKGRRHLLDKVSGD